MIDSELSIINDRVKIKGLFRCFVEEHDEYASFELLLSIMDIFSKHSMLSENQELREHFEKCRYLLKVKKASDVVKKWVDNQNL
jgi:hypothetical protein